MNTRWIQTSAGVMLSGVAATWVSGCAGSAPPSASAEPIASTTVMIFDDEVDLPTQAEADEHARSRIDRMNADEQFEMLVSEIDGVYLDE